MDDGDDLIESFALITITPSGPAHEYLQFFANHKFPLRPEMNPREHLKRIANANNWGKKRRETELQKLYTIVSKMFGDKQIVSNLVKEITGTDIASLSNKKRKAFLRKSRFNIWKLVARFAFGEDPHINVFADINHRNLFKKSYAKGCWLKLLLVEVL